MKTFKLVRDVDVSGVSGTGIVAEGVVFHDGQTVVSWYGQYHSIEVHASIAQVEAIHGHSGSTKVVFPEASCHACGELIPQNKECAVYCVTCDDIE